MNRTVIWIRQHGLGLLLGTLAAVIVTGAVLAIVSVLSTIVATRAWEQNFCFSSACIVEAVKNFEGSISIVSAFSKIAAWIAAVGGIVVALLNYLNSTAATAFGNHVSHSRIFYDYVSSEIQKRDRIQSKNVDIYRIYTLAFSSSRLGIMSVSDEYKRKISNLAAAISRSNELSASPPNASFRFKDHQHRIIAALSDLGISVTTQPRIDFFEIEDEIIGLIDAINQVFCIEEPIDRLPTRIYR